MIKEKPFNRLVGGYSNTSIFRTMGFIGDSLSSGEFETFNREGERQYNDLYEYSWGQYIARRNGIKAYNFSRGGMTAKWYMESFAEENDFFNKAFACQAYVIALGVNDLLNQNFELGNIGDINLDDPEKNADTFAGYYAQIISKYKEISPDAKFFLVSIPDELGDYGFKEKKEAMLSLLDDFAVVFSNTYVIDIYNNSCPFDVDFKKEYYLNGHLNPMGYIYAAEMIDSYINYIINRNPDDFRYVGLINSGIDYVK